MKEQKNIITRKRLIWFIVAIAFVFLGIQLFNYFYLKSYMPEHSKEVKTEFGSFIYGENLVSEDSARIVIEEINLALKTTDEFLNMESRKDLKIIALFSQPGISKAYPSKGVIVFYFPNHFKPPYIHEYIHVQLGRYKEYWFTEGFATYLNEKIKLELPLAQQYTDIGNVWFKEERSNGRLCSISDLTAIYGKPKLRNFFNLNQSKVDFNSLNEKVDYYKMSASFCEYLTNELGPEKIIQIAKEKKSNTSIVHRLKAEDVDVEAHYERWLKNL